MVKNTDIENKLMVEVYFPYSSSVECLILDVRQNRLYWKYFEAKTTLNQNLHVPSKTRNNRIFTIDNNEKGDIKTNFKLFGANCLVSDSDEKKLTSWIPSLWTTTARGNKYSLVYIFCSFSK